MSQFMCFVKQLRCVCNMCPFMRMCVYVHVRMCVHVCVYACMPVIATTADKVQIWDTFQGMYIGLYYSMHISV